MKRLPSTLIHDLIVGSHGQPGLIGSVAEIRVEQSHLRADMKHVRKDLDGVASKLDELLMVMLAKQGVAPPKVKGSSLRSQLAGQAKSIVVIVALLLGLLQGVWAWYSGAESDRVEERGRGK